MSHVLCSYRTIRPWLITAEQPASKGRCHRFALSFSSQAGLMNPAFDFMLCESCRHSLVVNLCTSRKNILCHFAPWTVQALNTLEKCSVEASALANLIGCRNPSCIHKLLLCICSKELWHVFVSSEKSSDFWGNVMTNSFQKL